MSSIECFSNVLSFCGTFTNNPANSATDEQMNLATLINMHLSVSVEPVTGHYVFFGCIQPAQTLDLTLKVQSIFISVVLGLFFLTRKLKWKMIIKLAKLSYVFAEILYI